MLRKIFRKTFLLSGILLLSVFVIVQYSWGCDDKDKRGCDDHDKWSCHKHGEPCHPPKIEIVYLDYDADTIYFTIYGENFYNDAPPAVTLGGIFELTVHDYDEDEIIAELSIKDKDFYYGDYGLVVSTCHNYACKDKYCKDHGPKCKCKYCKDRCSKCKDKYCKDHEYKCKCKDRYSLTIPDPSGQPGMIRSKIVKSEGTADIPKQVFEGSASCPAGYTVTGGGFSASGSVTILVSKPLDEGKGWFVSGTVYAESVELEVYAVCVQIQ